MKAKKPVFSSGRRRFLGHAGLGVAGFSAASTLGTLGLIREAVALPGPPGDYKALVCLFEYGGNDSMNMTVPMDAAEYDRYAQDRQELAVPRESVLTLSNTAGGRPFGFHPSLPELRDLFDQGRAAVLCNVGPLVEPTTKAQYENGSVELPPQLFSHSDQQDQWQTLAAKKGVDSFGWGGRLGDLFYLYNNTQAISMNISVAGSNRFQTGRYVSHYDMNSNGPAGLDGMTGSQGERRLQILQAALDMAYVSPMQTAFRDTVRRAMDSYELINSLLDGAPPFTTVFPDNSLGDQLHLVAQLIRIAPSLGFRRQIFFVSKGGWDTHDYQLDNHPGLLSQVSQGLAAFYQATVELGLANQVTSFTASDFGRTFNSNGDGSDHGWGGQHFLVGGAVRGGQFHGVMPVYALEGPDTIDRGRFIPTTAVDQMAATLAHWFGVPTGDLDLVVPNIGSFNDPVMDFMIV